MDQGASRPFGWIDIVRLGLVQVALGAIIVLTTSTLNRVMVVELALPASLPGLLVGWHYAVQITRPRWGYGADQGGGRKKWILGGMGVLGLGALAAAASTLLLADQLVLGIVASFFAFMLIGGGVGAAGTNLLAVLAIKTPPARKAAAAAIVWIMMIFGFVLTAGIAGSFLDPFSLGRLMVVTLCVVAIALAVSFLALLGLNTEPGAGTPPQRKESLSSAAFLAALRDVWRDQQARRFTFFVFVSMLAYSAQDLILEPFAGLVHGYTPGESTKLAATQNSGVLLGMIGTAILGTVYGRSRAKFMRHWTWIGCIASAISLGFLTIGALTGEGYPLSANVFALGFSNGMFAVAAIGSMMTLASAGNDAREGTRMGIWGAAQATAFGLGGLLGAAAIDIVRGLFGDIPLSFAVVFTGEAITFVAAAGLALWVGETHTNEPELPFLPADPLVAE